MMLNTPAISKQDCAKRGRGRPQLGDTPAKFPRYCMWLFMNMSGNTPEQIAAVDPSGVTVRTVQRGIATAKKRARDILMSGLMRLDEEEEDAAGDRRMRALQRRRTIVKSHENERN